MPKNTIHISDVTKISNLLKNWHLHFRTTVECQLQASGEAKAAKNLRAAGEVINTVFCILYFRGNPKILLYFILYIFYILR